MGILHTTVFWQGAEKPGFTTGDTEMICRVAAEDTEFPSKKFSVTSGARRFTSVSSVVTAVFCNLLDVFEGVKGL